jgi:hypothetical protein
LIVVVARGGFCLELLGLAIALWGYWRTWRDLETDEGFFAPILGASRRMWSTVRRLFRQQSAYAGTGQAAFVVGLALAGQGYAPPTQLPDAAADPRAFAEAVQANLNGMARRAHEAEVRLHKGLDATRSRIVDLERCLTQRIDQGERVAISRTVRGLREQVAGWTFIVVGLVMQSPALF